MSLGVLEPQAFCRYQCHKPVALVAKYFIKLMLDGPLVKGEEHFLAYEQACAALPEYSDRTDGGVLRAHIGDYRWLQGQLEYSQRASSKFDKA